MSHDIDPLVGRISPVTDTRAAELLTGAAAADLAGRITATEPAEADGPAVLPPPTRIRARRRPTIGLPLLAAGTAGVMIAATLAARSGEPGDPRRPSAPAQTTQERIELVAALDFTRGGRHLDVRIRDPYADPERYRKEFAEHGLNVRLSLVPVSPSLVGTVVMEETSAGTRPGDFTGIRVKGACEVPSGGDDCTVGVRIRIGYKGSAQIVFGRAARHGEQYESTAQADAAGEALHGMAYRERRLSRVLAELKERNITVPEYRVEANGQTLVRRPGQVPGNWYVHDAALWANGQVLLFVGPEPTAHEARPPGPATPGDPVPSNRPPTNVTPGEPPAN